MGTWASYVISREEDGLPQDARQLVEAARPGWAWWELPPMAEELLARLAGEGGPVVLASVADSDVCVVSGWFGGQLRWRWVYGEATAGEGKSEQLEAFIVDRARAAVTGIADWRSPDGRPVRSV